MNWRQTPLPDGKEDHSKTVILTPQLTSFPSIYPFGLHTRLEPEDAERTTAAIQTLRGNAVRPRFKFIMNRAPKVEEIGGEVRC